MASGGLMAGVLETAYSILKLGFLSESQTDFIIAIAAEELGSIGVLIVILILILKGSGLV
jgi:cell division protein FtsW (lipid II flippase)